MQEEHAYGAARQKASPDTLSLDLTNPRIPDKDFKDEDEAISYLYIQADLGELIQSIGKSGWLDFEPVIVEETTQTVVEGNRRLAALRIIANRRLQEQFRVTLPEPLHPNAIPLEIQVTMSVAAKRHATSSGSNMSTVPLSGILTRRPDLRTHGSRTEKTSTKSVVGWVIDTILSVGS